jgi:ankyrin repeat protein
VQVRKSTLDENDLADTNVMVSLCAGLVTIDEESDIIRLVHDTTREYLQTHIFCLTHESEEDPAMFDVEKNDIAMADAQNTITTICVTYLSFTVFESGFCQTGEEFEDRLQSNPLYDYAARNWGHHAREALTLCQQVVGFLESELKTEAASQALLPTKRYSGYLKYSQVPSQMTGLHLAAYFGVHEAANILIRRGQSLDLKDGYGRTPLSYAAEGGYEAVVALLLEKGAQLEIKGADCQTPLSYAADKGHEAVVALLLENGAQLETVGFYCQTPLSYAADKGHEAVVALLLENGAQLEAEDTKYGRTPLSYAAEGGHEAVAALLVEKGAQLEAKGTDGWTPLLYAAIEGHEVVVKLLLEKGAQKP